MAMTLGRCSMRGPAEAETPAMMPSPISAAASACATGASSLARLAATKTVTPELGASGRHAHPAGGGERLVEVLPQRPRIIGARRDLPLEFLPGEFFQRGG